MGIFNLFNKKQKITDAFWGELVYTTFKDKTKNFYACNTLFNAEQIGVIIYADEAGPTTSQNSFYLSLCDHYPVIYKNKILPQLKSELQDWIENEQHLDNLFSIDGVALRRITDPFPQWSLTLYCLKIDHFVTIDFVGFEPQEGVVIDG